MKLRKLPIKRTGSLEVRKVYIKRKEITPSSHTYPYLAAAVHKTAAATTSVVDPFRLYKQYIYTRFIRSITQTRTSKKREEPQDKLLSYQNGLSKTVIPGHFFHPNLSARTLKLFIITRSLMDRGAFED